MNLFNCFQAVAFYTITPVLIQYLFANGYTGFAYMAVLAEIVGFVLISFAIHDNKSFK